VSVTEDEAKDPLAEERDAFRLIRKTAGEWVKTEISAYRRTWTKVVKLTDRPKQDQTPRLEGEALNEALRGLAYDFVMLEASLRKTIELAGVRDRWRELTVGSYVVEVGPTSGATDERVLPPPVLRFPMTEYRACFEWSLILARKVADVVSRIEPETNEDLLACYLIGDPTYRLDGLPGMLRTRISRRVPHHNLWEDPDGADWPIGELLDWTVDRCQTFRRDLRQERPVVGRTFDRYVGLFRAEVGLDWRRSDEEE
jgi:hypothetical protein